MQSWWRSTSTGLAAIGGEGFFFAAGGAHSSNGLIAIPANTLWAIPFVTGRLGGMKGFMLRVESLGTGGAPTVWGGVYGARGYNYPVPYERIWDASTVTPVAGAMSVFSRAVGNPLLLPPGGLVFLVAWMNTSCTIVGLDQPLCLYGLDPSSFLTPNIALTASYALTGPPIFPNSFSFTASAIALGASFVTSFNVS